MLAKSLCVAVRAEQLLVTVIAEKLAVSEGENALERWCQRMLLLAAQKIQCSSRMTSLTHLQINYVTFHCVESLFRLIIEWHFRNTWIKWILDSKSNILKRITFLHKQYPHYPKPGLIHIHRLIHRAFLVENSSKQNCIHCHFIIVDAE